MRKRIISLRRLSLVIGAAFLFGTPAAYAASNNAPAPIAAAAHKAAAPPITNAPAVPPQRAALSPAATAQLTKRLDAMIGNTGTKVPGLGVILYRNGQEVYSPLPAIVVFSARTQSQRSRSHAIHAFVSPPSPNSLRYLR